MFVYNIDKFSAKILKRRQLFTSFMFPWKSKFFQNRIQPCSKNFSVSIFFLQELIPAEKNAKDKTDKVPFTASVTIHLITSMNTS